ncbi:MAG: hypothetical protein GY919_18435 [Photobacterium aquimaris]|uniref:Uncharacterized protein n=1 Tax=Photobacterium aquimaris TaxID=512643 RepID=A0A2T3HYW5_9GAMM|nr:hypothetical protein [Photobacterium aquimaris]PSU05929.1 hypothetical protein C0W81_07725 [Photobacterium aquimaris]
MSNFYVGSEIGQLRRVLIHRPERALNNLFTRDTSCWVYGGVSINPMAKEVRQRETNHLRAIYRWHPTFAGQYFRRVVPSPQPIGIVECDALETLIKRNHLVICTSGDGILVKRENNKLVGVEAVIDKDMSATYLAKQLNADALIILTNADAVYLDWGKYYCRQAE